MKMETERIINISELEAIHRKLYQTALQLREEIEKENPSMEKIEEFSKIINLESLKAVDFEFCLDRRIVSDKILVQNAETIIRQIVREEIERGRSAKDETN